MNQYVFYLIHHETRDTTSVGFQVHTLRQAYQHVYHDFPEYDVEDVVIYPL